MRNLIRNTCLIVALAAGVVPDAFAQDFANNPNRIFAGCDDDARAPASSNPRDRIEQRGGPTVDRFTQRTFASFTMDDVERGISDEMSVLCWARLDGVWQESRSIVSDRSKNDGTIWGASSRELISLTNGNYTTLGHIVIVETENPERTIYLATGLSGAPFVRFQSTDEMKFEDVFKRGGPQKTYIANNPFAFGSRMTVDVTRSGRVRLRLGNRQFLRPKPGVSESVADNQLAADDAFLIGYQLDNLPATRRGYDIISQDPFFLLNNSKAEVFAEVDPRQYSITEKRIVPVGFKLVREDSQGTVYRKEVMSSEQSIQETVSHTMGGSVSGAGFAGPLPVQGKVSLDASIATSKSMSQNQSIARAIGYSRTKKYALVVDHPYVQLSDDFIDAIDDARSENNYQALIDRFGTHYPYAVTYGAAAKVTQSFDENGYKTKAREEWGVSGAIEGAVGVDVLGAGGSAHYGIMSQTETGNSGQFGSENAEFVGVGGTGSWDQNGWAAGETPYPILLDLRPIDQLLNPMNFPGEPQIYDTVRQRLRKAIAAYLNADSRRLKTESMLPLSIEPLAPGPKAEPVQTWYVYIRQIWCDGLSSYRAKTVSASTLTIESYWGTDDNKQNRKSTRKTDNLDVVCKAKTSKKTLSYNAKSPGLLVIRGTATELRRLTVKVSMTWKYDPGFKDRKSEKMFSGELYGLGVNKTKDKNWTVNAATLPDFTLRVRFKRKK